MADAIRDELRNDLMAEYGSIEAAAEAIGMPYKTLYRALTAKGKDRSQSVKLDLVMEVAQHLSNVGRSNFDDVYSRAASRTSSDRGEGDYNA